MNITEILNVLTKLIISKLTLLFTILELIALTILITTSNRTIVIQELNTVAFKISVRVVITVQDLITIVAVAKDFIHEIFIDLHVEIDFLRYLVNSTFLVLFFLKAPFKLRCRSLE